MMILSNPRNAATVNDWPSGSRRVTAIFEVETNKRGQRVSRVTRATNMLTSKPKRTTYYVRIAIVDGDDGRVYLLGDTGHNQIVLIPGTLKTTEYFHESDPEFAEYKSVLHSLIED